MNGLILMISRTVKELLIINKPFYLFFYFKFLGYFLLIQFQNFYWILKINYSFINFKEIYIETFIL